MEYEIKDRLTKDRRYLERFYGWYQEERRECSEFEEREVHGFTSVSYITVCDLRSRQRFDFERLESTKLDNVGHANNLEKYSRSSISQVADAGALDGEEGQDVGEKGQDVGEKE